MKLLKIDGNYYLTTDKQTETCYHIGNKELLAVIGVGEKSGEVHHNKGWNHPNEVWFIDLDVKLSLMNCMSIEAGVDIEKLASNYANTVKDYDIPYSNGLFYGFVAGFRKAMEVLAVQSEWDVVLEVEKVGSKITPELDGSNCVILKRV